MVQQAKKSTRFSQKGALWGLLPASCRASRGGSPAALNQEPEGTSSLPRPAPAVATLFEKGSPTALTVYIPSDLELLKYLGTRALEHKAIPGTTGLRLRTSGPQSPLTAWSWVVVVVRLASP